MNDSLQFTSIAKGINLEAAGMSPKAPVTTGVHGTLSVHESIIKGVQTIVHTDSYDDLEKGVFAETFQYEEKYSFPVRKSGKEMKSSLASTVKFMESEMAKCMKQVESCLSGCSSKPKASVSGYMTRGLDAKMPKLPMMFTYSDIEKYRNEKGREEGTYMSPMSKYNECVRRYVSLCVDKIYAETMMNGLAEDREYVLSIKQAAQL